MKKTFKFYTIIWTVLLILFFVIVFVPFSWVKQKYTSSFWIGCIFVTISFVAQLICSYFALKEENIKKVFYNVSLIMTSYLGLAVSFVCGCLCMLLPFLPYWFAIVLCSIACAFNIIAVTKTCTAISYVSDIDKKVKKNTIFVKKLVIDAEKLITQAQDETLRAECKKVYEALRYSDPVSHDALSFVESEIAIKFSRFSDAVAEEDFAIVTEIGREILALIGERNAKCKLLK